MSCKVLLVYACCPLFAAHLSPCFLCNTSIRYTLSYKAWNFLFSFVLAAHDLASLGVLELFLVVSLASWHSLALTSSVSLRQVGGPSLQQGYVVLLFLEILWLSDSLPAGLPLHQSGLWYPLYRFPCAGEGLPGSLHYQNVTMPLPSTPEGSSLLYSKVLHSFHGLRLNARDSAPSFPD